MEKRLILLWILSFLTFSISGCQKAGEKWAGGKRPGGINDVFYLLGRVPGDVRKTTFGREDEVVEPKRDERFS